MINDQPSSPWGHPLHIFEAPDPGDEICDAKGKGLDVGKRCGIFLKSRGLNFGEFVKSNASNFTVQWNIHECEQELHTS